MGRRFEAPPSTSVNTVGGVRVAVPRERRVGERRVALSPRVAEPLVEEGHLVRVERDAGLAAGFANAEYETAGVEVADGDVATDAEVVLRVGPPTLVEVDLAPEGSAIIAQLAPITDHELVGRLVQRRLTGLAVEAVPRMSIAQSMDALSSQATAGGYAAVLLAATLLPRFFPMLTTAAGTVAPARVLVLGAGVAGLQAIATARRLGSVVSAYDLRPEVEEQIQSLGARFVAGPIEDQASASGYATEVDATTQRRQLDALAEHTSTADVIIATASVPGGAAPLLISREMVEGMQPGSVIVDLAAGTGGNCELSRPDQTVVHHGVTVVGPTDLPSTVAHDASQMYARNVVGLLHRLAPDGHPVVDLDDPVIGGCCITHAGEVVHAGARQLLGLEERADSDE